MLHKKFLICALLLICGHMSWAGAGFPCARRHSTQKTTLADPAEDNYDIKYLKFNIKVSDTSVAVSGNVSTTAQVTASSLGAYVFELDTSFTIDSAKINGTLYTTTHSGFIRTITLSSSLPMGAMFTAQIFYHGLPPGGTGGFFNGITHAVTSGGSHVVFTISDPYVAKNWWPCKQSIPDKIDSMDMFVTVPAHVADGSNGVLVGVDTTTTPGFWKYHWKTNYKIDYYLISIAVARYAQYKSYWHFTGSTTDSVLIHNFFLDTATFNPAYKPGFDSIGRYMDYFSSLYGRYPFWQEKYGVCYTTLPGGMENQTMTTIGVPNTYIIAHELCHQWFGDHVTYKTWGDVWLSEGFATFSEQLFLTHFWSAAAGRAQRLTYQNLACSDACGKLYVDDTTNADSLFKGTTVYAKGQAVVRMLQYMAPSDSVFFSVLKNYQSTYAFGHASTADLKAMAESAYGIPLDTFFNQWVYGRGFPYFRLSWDQVGSTVYVKLIQTTSCPTATPHFSTWVELQLHSAAGDTFVKVYDNVDTQVFVFNWAPAMTNVYLNPDIWTLCQQVGPTVKDVKLGTGAVLPKKLKVTPNPTNNHWQIDDLAEGTSLVLLDVSGRAVWEGKSHGSSTTIPGSKLPAGDYYLHLGQGADEESVKLVHW